MSNIRAGRTLPIQDSMTEPFWRGAKDRRLMMPLSPETGEISWPPYRNCLVEGNYSPKWVEVSGTGTVYTFSIIYRSSHVKPPAPYVLAIVLLTEGVYMTTNIVNVDPNKVRIGMPVKVAFEDLESDLRLPVFTPVD